jgi:hypothetical protein
MVDTREIATLSIIFVNGKDNLVDLTALMHLLTNVFDGKDLQR